jgi:hypothetical protein
LFLTQRLGHKTFLGWLLTRIIHDVRFRLWRGNRGEAVFEYCEPRMTKPEMEDDIAFGEETMDAYIV